MISKLNTQDNNFSINLKKLLAWESVANSDVNQTVYEIIENIKQNGDSSLLQYTNKFDSLNIVNSEDLKLDKKDLKKAYEGLTPDQRSALVSAAKRVKDYHLKQVQETWTYQDDFDNTLGQKITPLDSVGLYVPGGKAAYPSSVLMNAIPAKVAGVENLIMVVPTPHGVVNNLVLAAAYISDVDQVFTIGGAQAVAALAYGTETVPNVNKIVGPGNIYVAAAKRAVFGKVGIDMIAGPSEILIICDGKTNPDWIAMDLFSQAEHDEDAQSILLCPDESFIEKVIESIARLLPTMKRRDIIAKALKDRGAIIKTKTLDEAVDLINRIAPEHLEVSTENPMSLLPKIKHAGAIFLGKNTCESLGDYCAGPNHVLPTSGTARYSSPLGVYDFQKKSSIIMASDQGSTELGKIASILADEEGLQAHAESARYRID